MIKSNTILKIISSNKGQWDLLRACFPQLIFSSVRFGSVQFNSALDNTFTLTYDYSFQFNSVRFSSIQFSCFMPKRTGPKFSSIFFRWREHTLYWYIYFVLLSSYYMGFFSISLLLHKSSKIMYMLLILQLANIEEFFNYNIPSPFLVVCKIN